ncbi:hypothetical protein [Microbispora sp. CA-102843]
MKHLTYLRTLLAFHQDLHQRARTKTGPANPAGETTTNDQGTT